MAEKGVLLCLELVRDAETRHSISLRPVLHVARNFSQHKTLSSWPYICTAASASDVDQEFGGEMVNHIVLKPNSS
jgi:hypothetical protein